MAEQLMPREFGSTIVGESRYSFGLTNSSVAEGLRKLATDIESGAYGVQSIKLEECATAEDFALQTWTLKFIAAKVIQTSE